jgi:CBS domain containing-hemolysin-like protein
MATSDLPADRPAGTTSSADITAADQSTGEDGRNGSAGSWLAALRAIIGLENPTLRDTIEDALRTGNGAEGAFTDQEREMLLRLLHYNALRVEDVMVPRADIIAVEDTESVGAVLQKFVAAGVSRMPLFHETLDDPRGMVHVKDLVRWLVQAARIEDGEAGGKLMTPEAGASTAEAPPVIAAEVEAAVNGSAFAGLEADFGALDFSRVNLDQSVSSTKVRRSVLFVPPSMPVMNLLLRMQSTRKHMALVVDEYGGTDGLITIEDLVEQIVGQIEDEHDEDEERNIIRDPRLGLVAVARTPIEELEAHLGVSLAIDDDDDVDTLGGLVFSLAGSVPVRGEIVRHPAGFEFEVLDADPRRIKRLRINAVQRDEADATTGEGGAADKRSRSASLDRAVTNGA